VRLGELLGDVEQAKEVLAWLDDLDDVPDGANDLASTRTNDGQDRAE
jgi:hypothetical protein